jgi:hypothetical protein
MAAYPRRLSHEIHSVTLNFHCINVTLWCACAHLAETSCGLDVFGNRGMQGIMMQASFYALGFALLSVLLPCSEALGSAGETGATDARYQVTYIWQQKEGFSVPYSGLHSLTATQEDSYSLSATAYLGYRPWQGGEVYLNPEVVQGVPLSGLTGLAGETNAEIARASSLTPSPYRARAFLRQTWGFGGGSEPVAADANQLAGSADRNRLVLTVGNFSVLDIFDNNVDSHDPRTQFMNLSIMTHGAYDYAADAHGYSRGFALEYYQGDLAVRAGRFLEPKVPDQQALGADIFSHYGDQIELARGFRLAGQPGRIRLLGYRNKTVMSRYNDALALAAQTGATPDLGAVRYGNQTKQGVGINAEQAITDDLNCFARAMRSDGQTETYAFAEIDSSASIGLTSKGTKWQRNDDGASIALARNALSRAHRDYLAAGGLGFFVGDGQLAYQPEYILEAFYAMKFRPNLWVTPDWQYIRNPAYNADRGSLHVISMRLHSEF